MSDGSVGSENFEVISAGESFVSEKVDFVELGQILEAVGLVPPRRENVERNLAPDRKRQFISELLLQSRYHCRSDLKISIYLSVLNLRIFKIFGEENLAYPS